MKYRVEVAWSKNLIDYDGVFSLPTDVIWAVRKLGFHVGEGFE